MNPAKENNPKVIAKVQVTTDPKETYGVVVCDNNTFAGFYVGENKTFVDTAETAGHFCQETAEFPPIEPEGYWFNIQRLFIKSDPEKTTGIIRCDDKDSEGAEVEIATEDLKYDLTRRIEASDSDATKLAKIAQNLTFNMTEGSFQGACVILPAIPKPETKQKR